MKSIIALTAILACLIQVQAEDVKFFFKIPSNSAQCFMESISADHQGKYILHLHPSKFNGINHCVFIYSFILL